MLIDRKLLGSWIGVFCLAAGDDWAWRFMSPPRARKRWPNAGPLLGMVILFCLPVSAQDISFANPTQVNGSASLAGGVATLTTDFSQAGSIFATQKQCITNYHSVFDFQETPIGNTPVADGVTFTVQNDSRGATALGAAGGALGYLFGITPSVASGLDYGHDNFGEGLNSLDLLYDGSFYVPPFLNPSPIDLTNTDVKHVDETYNASTKTLVVTITDTTTHLSFSHTYTGLDIPSIVGGTTAYVGFTGGTGALRATQKISNWTFTSPPPTISSVSASPNTIWPSNQKFVGVTVNYGTTDACSAPVCTLSVSSNEPGDGVEWNIIDAHHVQLLADRNGNGNGRIYTILITCTDAGGNVSTATVAVTVPHDQGN